MRVLVLIVLFREERAVLVGVLVVLSIKWQTWRRLLARLWRTRAVAQDAERDVIVIKRGLLRMPAIGAWVVRPQRPGVGWRERPVRSNWPLGNSPNEGDSCEEKEGVEDYRSGVSGVDARGLLDDEVDDVTAIAQHAVDRDEVGEHEPWSS